MRVRLGVLLYIIMFSIIMTGCFDVGNERKEANTIDKKDEVRTITMMAPSGELYQIDRTLMTAYEAYSGNRIDFQEIPDDQYANVLKTKMATGQGPDIAVIWAGANAAQFFPDENFVDLSEEEWVSRESDIALENQMYNKKVIGFGLEGISNGWGMIYNKMIFQLSGIDVPKSMDDFMIACKKIKEAEYTPYVAAFNEEWTLGVLLANMGPLASTKSKDYYQGLNSNQATMSQSPVFLQFIRDYKMLYDKGYIGELSFSNTARDAFVQVLEGRAGMAMSNSTPEVWIADSGLDIDLENYGMFPIPFADNKMISTYKGGFIRVINNKSDNVDVCKDYFVFLAQSKSLEAYYDAPERKGISPAFTDFADQQSLGYLQDDLINNSDGRSYQIAETGLKYWDNTKYGSYIMDAMLGSNSPEEALALIDEERLKMFEAE